MSNSFSVLCLIVLIFLYVGCPSDAVKVDRTEDRMREWTEVRAENFVLSIPKELSREKVDGVDGYAARYSNALMTVSIESRAGSESVANLKRVSRILNFTEEPIDRDRMKGTRAVFQFEADETNFQDKNKTFVRMLSIDCKWSVESVTVMVLYQKPSDADTADKILDSVRVECSE